MEASRGGVGRAKGLKGEQASRGLEGLLAAESRARPVRGPSVPPSDSAWLGGEGGEGIRCG